MQRSATGKSVVMAQRPETGMTIEGKYRLERELGAGGMGAVWLATQLMVDRKVAVKLLHPMFLDEQDLQARFEVEAKAIGRLNHPNCITLYDFGFSEELGAFYTVIEYIEGVSLDKRLGKPTPLPDILSIIRQCAMALDHAHHHGIVHRDLKPENIMLASMTDGSEMVKVLDFGIARIMKGEGDGESQRITKAGEVFGTPAYMSPEQARSVRQITPAADLYALGIMFYELVMGTLPFTADSAFDVLMMHVTKPVPEITQPDIPQVVKDIIFKLLEKEPEDRYQSGKALLSDLRMIDEASIGDISVNLSRNAVQDQLRLPNSTPTPTVTPDPRVVTNPSISGNVNRGAVQAASTRAAAYTEDLPAKKPWLHLLVAIVVVSLFAVALVVISNTLTSEEDLSAEPSVEIPEDPKEKPIEPAVVVVVPEVEKTIPDTSTNGPTEVVTKDEPEIVEPEPVKTTKKTTKKRTKKTKKTTPKVTTPPKVIDKPKPKRGFGKFDTNKTEKKSGMGAFDVSK